MSYQIIARKWNSSKIVLKYLLSETIHAQQNGRRGTHFAKFLNSKFLKGLTSSALREFTPKLYSKTDEFAEKLQVGSLLEWCSDDGTGETIETVLDTNLELVPHQCTMPLPMSIEILEILKSKN